MNPLPTPVTPISVVQAYEAAKVGCSRGSISQIEPPGLIEAHLIGARQAEFLLACPNADCVAVPVTPEPGEALVWWVILEGRWQLTGGPAATSAPGGQTSTPTYLGRCQTIVDATTGVVSSNQRFLP